MACSYINCQRCLAITLALLVVGCSSGDDNTSADSPVNHTDDPPAGTNNDPPLASDLLDAEFFIDPTSSVPRAVEVSQRLTRAVIEMEAADPEEKNVRAYIFSIKRDKQWWVDSLHDKQATAFERQDRLIRAGHVQPEDCQVRARIALRVPDE